MRNATVDTNRRILLIDGDAPRQAEFRRCLSTPASAPQGATIEFALQVAEHGSAALFQVQQAVIDLQPFAAVFVDGSLAAPCDALTTVARLWRVDPELQVVLSAADGELPLDQVIRELGTTDRWLLMRKPLRPADVQSLALAATERWNANHHARNEIDRLESWMIDAQRVLHILEQSQDALQNAHIESQLRVGELAQQLRQRTAETIATRDVTVLTLAKLAESRDPETGEHLERMRDYAQIIAEYLSHKGPFARQIDARFLEDLYRSSPLHDIGKVGVPDSVLLKPGRLTVEEFEVMKRHTLIGAEALRQVACQASYAGFLDMAVAIARHHHERYDGTGYPDGLVGDGIPLAARIVALADVFDALTSVRVYKDAVDPDVTRTLIEEQAGRHFDPAVVAAMGACYDRFLEVYHTRGARPAPLAVATGSLSSAGLQAAAS